MFRKIFKPRKQILPVLAPRAPHLYKYWKGDWSKCVYCGAPATCEDHVLPKSIAYALSKTKWSADLLQIVPACHNCNSTVGNKLFASFRDKQQYIRSRLCLRAAELHLRKLGLKVPVRSAEFQSSLEECLCEAGRLCLRIAKQE